MALTENQLLTLRIDLQNLANIEYNDVMTELLDHYASLTEQYMANGLPFTESSKWAWADLGSGVGLQALQTDFIRMTQRHLRQQHWTIVKSYFRWPILLTTLLVGTLIHLVVPLIPAQTLLMTTIAFGYTPAFLIRFAKAPDANGLAGTSKVLQEYLRKQAIILMFVSQQWLGIGSSLLFHDSDARLAFLAAHGSFSTVVFSILLLYIASFSQLLYLHFRAQLFLAAVHTSKLFN